LFSFTAVGYCLTVSTAAQNLPAAQPELLPAQPGILPAEAMNWFIER